MAILGALLGGALVAVLLLVRSGQAAARAARLEAELDATRRAAEEQKAALTASQTQLRDTFAALSRDALKENRQEFLQNADAVMKPVLDTLERVQAQLVDVDKHREGTFRAVSTQLASLMTAQEHLRQTTEGLSRSLRSPNVRGRWGEIQLKRIVELAGMLEQCDFIEKESATTEDGARQTPDLVVKLPGNTSIVVDSKVPIDAYLLATNAKTDAEREELLVAHAKQVREHIRSLGLKEYWKQFQPAPEFVVMFLPLEPLLSSAFEHDGTLLEFAATLRVIPATPMTLLAILRAVAYGWQQQSVAENAEAIQQLGRELYDRLATMVSHLDRLGANIKQSADSYDRFIGSLEQNVLPAARRFKELGVSSTKAIEVPGTLNLSMRRVRKEELAGAEASEPVESLEPFEPVEPSEPAVPRLFDDEPQPR
jgi:DNA recombination protein RmuC